MSKTDTIFIKDLRLDMAIGITSVERAKRQRVVVNISLFCDLSVAAKSENIDDTVNYFSVAKTIEALALSRHFDLLETFAEEIAALCLDYDGVDRVSVKAEKPNIVSELCSSVGVEIERP